MRGVAIRAAEHLSMPSASKVILPDGGGGEGFGRALREAASSESLQGGDPHAGDEIKHRGLSEAKADTNGEISGPASQNALRVAKSEEDVSADEQTQGNKSANEMTAGVQISKPIAATTVTVMEGPKHLKSCVANECRMDEKAISKTNDALATKDASANVLPQPEIGANGVQVDLMQLAASAARVDVAAAPVETSSSEASVKVGSAGRKHSHAVAETTGGIKPKNDVDDSKAVVGQSLDRTGDRRGQFDSDKDQLHSKTPYSEKKGEPLASGNGTSEVLSHPGRVGGNETVTSPDLSALNGVAGHASPVGPGASIDNKAAEVRTVHSQHVGGESSPQILAAGLGRLEVGVMDETHGWLKIRADLSGGGAVNASLTGSAAALESLRQSVPAMQSYLSSESVSVASIAVHRTAETAVRSDAQAGFASGADSQSGQKQGKSAEVFDAIRGGSMKRIEHESSVSWVDFPAAVFRGVGGYGGSAGSCLSVMA